MTDERQKKDGRNLAGCGFLGFGLLLCGVWSHLNSAWDGLAGIIVMLSFIAGIALISYPKKTFNSSFVKMGRRRRGLSWPKIPIR